jgi:hypothetical protein
MPLTSAQAVYKALRRTVEAWFVTFDPTGTAMTSTNVNDAVIEAYNNGGGGGTVLLDGGDASNSAASNNFGIDCGGASA